MLTSKAPASLKACSSSRSKRTCIVARASGPEQRAEGQRKIQHVLAAGFLAASLTLAPMVAAPLPSKAEGKASIAEAAYEQEALIKEQKGMLEFMLQQQENAKKAAILAQRQQLADQAAKVEASLAAKIIERQANVVGAKIKGDLKTAEAAEAAEAELQEKQAKIAKAAAQLSSQLDRMELIERARTIAAKQAVERATSEMDSRINGKLDMWLESIGKGFAR